MTKNTLRAMRTRTLMGQCGSVNAGQAGARTPELFNSGRVNPVHQGRRIHRMFTLFQRTLIVVLVFGFLVVALVVAAKAPAQATTFAPALSLPVNAVIPPGIVTTGDATVKAKR